MLTECLVRGWRENLRSLVFYGRYGYFTLSRYAVVRVCPRRRRLTRGLRSANHLPGAGPSREENISIVAQTGSVRSDPIGRRQSQHGARRVTVSSSGTSSARRHAVGGRVAAPCRTRRKRPPRLTDDNRFQTVSKLNETRCEH